MSKSKGSPRKFAEKIALLNKKEAETTAEFKKIIQGVEQITRAPSVAIAGTIYHDQNQFGWTGSKQDEFLPAALPTRSSSFSNWHTQMQQQNHTSSQQTMHQQQQPYHVRSDQNIQHMGQHTAFVNQVNFVRRTPQYERQPQQQQHQDSMMEGHSNGVAVDVQHSSSFRVPNIAIFPIDDEHNTCSQPPIIKASTTHHNGCYIDGDYLNDCSNPMPISSSRSLPNIANFGAPSTSPYETAGHHMQQALSPVNQRLAPVGDNYGNMIVTSRSSDNIIDSNGNYFDGQQRDYCSLPPFVQQIPQVTPGILNHDDLVRRSNTDIQQNESWQAQQIIYSNNNSAPSSVAPTQLSEGWL